MVEILNEIALAINPRRTKNRIDVTTVDDIAIVWVASKINIVTIPIMESNVTIKRNLMLLSFDGSVMRFLLLRDLANFMRRLVPAMATIKTKAIGINPQTNAVRIEFDITSPLPTKFYSTLSVI